MPPLWTMRISILATIQLSWNVNTQGLQVQFLEKITRAVIVIGKYLHGNMKAFYFIYVWFWDRVMYSANCLQTHCVAEDGLEHLILFLYPQCWYHFPCSALSYLNACGYGTPNLIHVVLQMKPRPSCMLVRHCKTAEPLPQLQRELIQKMRTVYSFAIK